jgi:hypothetical protein
MELLTGGMLGMPERSLWRCSVNKRRGYRRRFFDLPDLPFFFGAGRF